VIVTLSTWLLKTFGKVIATSVPALIFPALGV